MCGNEFGVGDCGVKRISLAFDLGCRTQCRSGDCWDNNNICFFITELEVAIADLGFL